MSGFIEGENRQQSTLFPERIDDYIGEDSPLRVVDYFIDKLDIPGLGFKTEPASTGRPGYHPGLLESGTKEHSSFAFLLAGIWREWANSLYQYESGLYDSSEFEPRIVRWKLNMRPEAVRTLWKQTRGMYSPALRERLDDFVQSIEQEEPET